MLGRSCFHLRMLVPIYIKGMDAKQNRYLIRILSNLERAPNTTKRLAVAKNDSFEFITRDTFSFKMDINSNTKAKNKFLFMLFENLPSYNSSKPTLLGKTLNQMTRNIMSLRNWTKSV